MELRHQPEWRMKQKLYFAEPPYLAVVWHFYLRISDEILAAYSEWNSPQK
jgi:hypothetical protein